MTSAAARDAPPPARTCQVRVGFGRGGRVGVRDRVSPKQARWPARARRQQQRGGGGGGGGGGWGGGDAGDSAVRVTLAGGWRAAGSCVCVRTEARAEPRCSDAVEAAVVSGTPHAPRPCHCGAQPSDGRRGSASSTMSAVPGRAPVSSAGSAAAHSRPCRIALAAASLAAASVCGRVRTMLRRFRRALVPRQPPLWAVGCRPASVHCTTKRIRPTHAKQTVCNTRSGLPLP